MANKKFTYKDWLSGDMDLAKLPAHLTGVSGQEPFGFYNTGKLEEADYDEIIHSQNTAFDLAREMTVNSRFAQFYESLSSIHPDRKKGFFDREILDVKNKIDSFDKWVKDRYDLNKKSTTGIDSGTYHRILKFYENYKNGGQCTFSLTWTSRVNGKFKIAINEDFHITVLMEYMDKLETLANMFGPDTPKTIPGARPHKHDIYKMYEHFYKAEKGVLAAHEKLLSWLAENKLSPADYLINADPETFHRAFTKHKKATYKKARKRKL